MPEWPWRYRSRSKVVVHDTPSHASDHLCLIWKESIQNCRRYRADTACGTDGRTDRRTDGVKPIYPPTTSLCGGYNYVLIPKITLVMCTSPQPSTSMNATNIKHNINYEFLDSAFFVNLSKMPNIFLRKQTNTGFITKLIAYLIRDMFFL